MRVDMPPPFSIKMRGEGGPYTPQFRPYNESDGYIDVEIAGVSMRWQVLRADYEPDHG